MKNILKFAFAGAILFGMASCEDDEQNTTDLVQETVERGAVLRTVSLISNSLPIGVPTAEFSVLLEEQDAFGGDLLESVDVEILFTDGSDDVGDSSNGIVGERVFVRNIPASDFEDGPFGLPRHTLTLPLTELLSLVNLTDEDIFGGDSFSTFLTLNLTDGRVFNAENAGGVITGGFFASPFQYLTPVVCPVNDDTFSGDYLVEQLTPSIFGYDTFDPDGGGVILTLIENDEDGFIPGTETVLEDTQRLFDADYLAALGFGNTRTFTLNFICGEVSIPTGSTTGVQCSAGITIGPPTDVFGTYDFQDDTSFVLIITDDETGDCGGAIQTSLSFTKQ
ncbi:hypothetical protein [uncultured Dokdonia sp.]|uniref:hypothetical protein n=1 Tax=uncultured Dokdonia sp. TaxID=575653 RepID=UPI0026240EF0|nr:hypothetical protein [uncultured Dokdonia sp.]